MVQAEDGFMKMETVVPDDILDIIDWDIMKKCFQMTILMEMSIQLLLHYSRKQKMDFLDEP